MVNIAPQKNGDDLGMFIPLAYHMDPYELDDLVVPVTRSTAFRWPCVFFDSWEVANDIGCARVSGILCYFGVKPVNALFTGSRMKRTISPTLPTRNLHFCGFFPARNYLVSTLFQLFCVHSSASSSSKFT